MFITYFISFISLATVILEFLESTKKLDEMDCPGDTISYNCSIMSNTEDLHLTWSVEFPNSLPINITYSDDGSLREIDMLDVGIRATLMDFRGGYVQSSITLVVFNSSMNGTIVKCSIANLDLDNVTILINTSG